MSTGSACSSGTLEPSHVLKAMNLPTGRSQNAIRFSLGSGTTDEEIDHLLGLLPPIVDKLRSLARDATRPTARAHHDALSTTHKAPSHYAHRRCHVRRSRLLGRGRASSRGRPRGGRIVDAAVRSARGDGTRLRPLLLSGRSARRAAGGGGDWHQALRPESRAAVPGTVIANFVVEYTAGRTPIPCTHCNSDLKFSTLVDRAAGFDRRSWAPGTTHSCLTIRRPAGVACSAGSTRARISRISCSR